MRKLVIFLLVIVVVLFLIKRKDMTWRQSFMKAFYSIIMFKGKIFTGKNIELQNQRTDQPPVSFYSLHATANNGTAIDLSQLKGKKVMIVNTASNCGYTGQFGELEELHQRFKDLVILGFPANDFKNQEQKNDEEIAQFCKVNYGVTFPLIKKTHVVKGPEQHAVFQWLTDPAKNGWNKQEPVWNFSKYIIDENGRLTNFFANTISPLDERVIKTIQ